MKLKFWDKSDTTQPKYIRASNGGIFVTIFLMVLAGAYVSTGGLLEVIGRHLIEVILTFAVTAILLGGAYFCFRREMHVGKNSKYNPPAALFMIAMVVVGMRVLYGTFIDEATQHEAILVSMIGVFVAHWTQLHRFIMEVADNPDPTIDAAGPTVQNEPTQAAA